MGQNAIYIDTDARSYRDLRIKSQQRPDDTSAPRNFPATPTWGNATGVAADASQKRKTPAPRGVRVDLGPDRSIGPSAARSR